MVNLKSAAIACGVVATCLGGGLGVSYVNSTFVDSTDIVEEVSFVSETSENEISETVSDTESAAASENATSNEKVTTSKMAYSDNESEVKSEESGNNESSTSEISTADNSANVTSAASAATVPAPVHALVTEEAETEETIIEAQTEFVTENVTEATPESVIAPIPPSAEALTQTSDTYVAGLADTANVDTSGTTVVSENSYGTLPITDEEYIILCNAVANEAGSDWISVYDKARVVEVIMNRVNSGLFPNTIYGVLAQPNQFEGSYGYVNLGTFSCDVTDSVKEAVNLYFSSPQTFSEGFFYFYGDGHQNYFY